MGSFIWIKREKRITQIDIANVLYIEGDKYGCTLYIILNGSNVSQLEKIKTQSKLSSIENSLKKFGYIRCHRNFIINPNWIKCFCKYTSSIKIEEIAIPVARRKKKEMESFSKL